MIDPPLQGRYPDRPHVHKWFFLQSRTESEFETGTTFRKREYAYFVCNNCPEKQDLPYVIKCSIEPAIEADEL